MALDKLIDSTQLDTDLTSVANAIRTKGGTSAQLAFPADFVSAIADIPTGGGATLLASYTVPENVSIVSIDYTSAMDGYDAYIMEIEGTVAGKTLYICPQLNTTNLKAYNGQTNAGGAFHKKYWVAPFTLSSSVDIGGYMVVVKKDGSQNSVTGAITNFVFASYYSNAYFAVGTVAKIWGV